MKRKEKNIVAGMLRKDLIEVVATMWSCANLSPCFILMILLPFPSCSLCYMLHVILLLFNYLPIFLACESSTHSLKRVQTSLLWRGFSPHLGLNWLSSVCVHLKHSSTYFTTFFSCNSLFMIGNTL